MYLKECKSIKCEFLKKIKGVYKCTDWTLSNGTYPEIGNVFDCNIYEDEILSYDLGEGTRWQKRRL